MNTRSIVLDMLIRINEDGLLSHLVIRETLAKLADDLPRDRAFIKRLTEGTLEHQIRIDYIIDLFAKIPVSQMKPLIRNLLRMSVYQIIFMDHVPDRAACDEAVKLAAQRGFSALKGFTNGILRNIIRQKDALDFPDEADEPGKYLSVAFSMPEWLVEKWREEYSYEKLQLILQGLLETRPVTVRIHAKEDNKNFINESFINENLINEWTQAVKASGADIHPHPYLPYAYELSGMDSISGLPGFQEGFFAVQDVSSMLACEAAGIKQTDIVVDICAAPGGKALHAASKGRMVYARDISETKCNLIRENAARLKQSNIEISVCDAAILDESLIGKADVLLADLPCSGFGAIGRKPDIKYKASPESVHALCELQRGILAVVWQYVKPGGVLIYSTCTMSRDENESMMEWFTEKFPFSCDPLPEPLPALAAPGEKNRSGILRLLPGIHQTDGFFICRLKRQN